MLQLPALRLTECALHQPDRAVRDVEADFAVVRTYTAQPHVRRANPCRHCALRTLELVFLATASSALKTKVDVEMAHLIFLVVVALLGCLPASCSRAERTHVSIAPEDLLSKYDHKLQQFSDYFGRRGKHGCFYTSSSPCVACPSTQLHWEISKGDNGRPG